MGTKLTLKAESHYRDILEDSKEVDTIIIESYIEGELNTLTWRLEQFVKLLLAEGYSIGMIKKYLNFDGFEVYEIEDTEV